MSRISKHNVNSRIVFSNPRLGRKFGFVALAALLLLISFSYGFTSGKFKFFPYSWIAMAREDLRNIIFSVDVDGVRRVFVTSHLELQKTTYNLSSEVDLAGSGGALSRIGDTIIGVDRDGKFFRYDGKGQLRLLPIALDNGKDIFISRALSNLSLEKDALDRILPSFRVLDITVQEEETRIALFVSHNYWNDEQKGKTIRISKLTLSQAEARILLDGRKKISENDWTVIYETKPLVKFHTDIESDFWGYHSGGQMVVNGDGDLFLTVGDQRDHYTNVDELSRSQDDVNDFGKVLQIDLQSLDVELFAKGLRNSQGIMIDSVGNLWATDHGPEGGDELNLLLEGSNYGWPYETYGTEYFSYSWPVSETENLTRELQHPVFSWISSIAPTDLIQLRDFHSEWNGDLLIGAMKAVSIIRIRVVGLHVIYVEEINIHERVRDLIQMADGTILLWSDSGVLIELEAG